MPLSHQVVWLFVLALPIASIAWTVTHEEVFREPRDYCARPQQGQPNPWCAASFSTCSPVNTASATGLRPFLVITRYKLLYDDWRGYLVALFALVYVSQLLYWPVRACEAGSRKNRAEIRAIEAEVEKKAA